MFRRLATGLTIAGLVTVVAPQAQAQGNTIFLELGGNGFIYSVNYERVLPSDVGLRAGIGYMSLSAAAGGAGGNASYVAIPLTFSYLGVGGGSAKLELGAGATFLRFSGAVSAGFGPEAKVGAFFPAVTGIIGLRLAPPGGGFNFKLAYTPFWNNDFGFFNWGGLAFGVGF